MQGRRGHRRRRGRRCRRSMSPMPVRPAPPARPARPAPPTPAIVWGATGACGVAGAPDAVGVGRVAPAAGGDRAAGSPPLRRHRPRCCWTGSGPSTVGAGRRWRARRARTSRGSMSCVPCEVRGRDRDRPGRRRRRDGCDRDAAGDHGRGARGHHRSAGSRAGPCWSICASTRSSGRFIASAPGPIAHSRRGNEIDRNARTYTGSNWVPAQRASSARAATVAIGFL